MRLNIQNLLGSRADNDDVPEGDNQIQKDVNRLKSKVGSEYLKIWAPTADPIASPEPICSGEAASRWKQNALIAFGIFLMVVAAVAILSGVGVIPGVAAAVAGALAVATGAAATGLLCGGVGAAAIGLAAVLGGSAWRWVLSRQETEMTVAQFKNIYANMPKKLHKAIESSSLEDEAKIDLHKKLEIISNSMVEVIGRKNDSGHVVVSEKLSLLLDEIYQQVKSSYIDEE